MVSGAVRDKDPGTTPELQANMSEVTQGPSIWTGRCGGAGSDSGRYKKISALEADDV
jgi:hypothetical protein